MSASGGIMALLFTGFVLEYEVGVLKMQHILFFPIPKVKDQLHGKHITFSRKLISL